jgi:hypothetical protein
VKAGKTATVVAVALRKQAAPPPPPTRAIIGLVRDARSGAGIAGARVDVVGTLLTATTDADGLFTLSDVSPADVALQVSAEGYAASSLTATAGEPSVRR